MGSVVLKKGVIIIVVLLVVAAGLGYYFSGGEREPKIGHYTPGDPFVTNIKESDKKIRVSIVLELKRDDQEEFLTEHNHMIRDVVVFTLCNKTEESLTAPGIEDALRKEIVEKVNEKLDIDYVKTVYFNDYVLQ
jgi:flagellar basal body-associated protein FliL